MMGDARYRLWYRDEEGVREAIRSGGAFENVFGDRQAGQPVLRLTGLPAYRQKQRGVDGVWGE
jgi:hypothetical protein